MLSVWCGRYYSDCWREQHPLHGALEWFFCSVCAVYVCVCVCMKHHFSIWIVSNVLRLLCLVFVAELIVDVGLCCYVNTGAMMTCVHVCTNFVTSDDDGDDWWWTVFRIMLTYLLSFVYSFYFFYYYYYYCTLSRYSSSLLSVTIVQNNTWFGSCIGDCKRVCM